MKQVFIFDMDNTLTPPAQPMRDSFARVFTAFCKNNDVRIVTGSPMEQVRDQIPEDVIKNTHVYPVLGAQTWRNGCLIHQQYGEEGVRWPANLIDRLVKGSFREIWSPLVEYRYGMLCYSPAGRELPGHMRPEYVKHDHMTGEREKIAYGLRLMFGNDYDFSLGGQTSIDITPKGANKARILDEVPEDAEVFFFGDKCEPGGNDYPVVLALEGRPGISHIYRVNNDVHTEWILDRENWYNSRNI